MSDIELRINDSLAEKIRQRIKTPLVIEMVEPRRPKADDSLYESFVNRPKQLDEASLQMDSTQAKEYISQFLQVRVKLFKPSLISVASFHDRIATKQAGNRELTALEREMPAISFLRESRLVYALDELPIKDISPDRIEELKGPTFPVVPRETEREIERVLRNELKNEEAEKERFEYEHGNQFGLLTDVVDLVVAVAYGEHNAASASKEVKGLMDVIFPLIGFDSARSGDVQYANDVFERLPELSVHEELRDERMRELVSRLLVSRLPYAGVNHAESADFAKNRQLASEILSLEHTIRVEDSVLAEADKGLGRKLRNAARRVWNKIEREINRFGDRVEEEAQRFFDRVGDLIKMASELVGVTPEQATVQIDNLPSFALGNPVLIRKFDAKVSIHIKLTLWIPPFFHFRVFSIRKSGIDVVNITGILKLSQEEGAVLAEAQLQNLDVRLIESPLGTPVLIDLGLTRIVNGLLEGRRVQLLEVPRLKIDPSILTRPFSERAVKVPQQAEQLVVGIEID
jgi:hypothetical protein